MWDLHGAPDVMIAFASLLAGTAAFWGAVTAARALDSWKSEAKWSRERDLARSILVLLYMNREAVAKVRNPDILSTEVSRATGKANEPPVNGDSSFLDLEKVYQARWSKVEETREKLYPLLIESKVIWGDVISKSFSDLWRYQSELAVEVEKYLRTKDPRYASDDLSNNGDSSFDKYLVFYQSSSCDVEDDFTRNCRDIFKEVKKFLDKKSAGDF
ncbi:hypothetical protein [Yoonia sp. MH D7]